MPSIGIDSNQTPFHVRPSGIYIFNFPLSNNIWHYYNYTENTYKNKIYYANDLMKLF